MLAVIIIKQPAAAEQPLSHFSIWSLRISQWMSYSIMRKWKVTRDVLLTMSGAPLNWPRGDQRKEHKISTLHAAELYLLKEEEASNPFIKQKKNVLAPWNLCFDACAMAGCLNWFLNFLYIEAIEFQDLFSFGCGLGDTSKRSGLCIVIKHMKSIFYTDLDTWINKQNILQWLLTVLSLRKRTLSMSIILVPET
jgi:hypothetical protein